MSTPLFGSTYGSRLNTDAEIGFSGGQKTYSSFIYTGFIGGGSLQSQELNELQEQNQFQTTKTNEFIGNWLKIESDPIDSPIFTKQIDNKISYIDPDVSLDIQPSVPSGDYLHNLTYFVKLPNLELPVSYDVSEFLNENILTEMINPFEDGGWESILQDTFNPDNLSPVGSHRKRYYSNSSSIICSARFHPNIEVYDVSADSDFLDSVKIIRKNTEKICDDTFTVKIQGTPDWISLTKSRDTEGVSGLNFDSSDFSGGLTAGFIIQWTANTGITRTADIKLESDTSNGWSLTNLTQIKIRQAATTPVVTPTFNITSLVSLSNQDTEFSVNITTQSPGTFTVNINSEADWITIPTSKNNFQFSSTQTISFNCGSQGENDEPRTATINFFFFQNGILIPGAEKTTTVVQSFAAASLLFNMPRLADLDIYGYSTVRSNYLTSIDTSPNLNLPYIFYDADNQWKYSNANSLDNYRYGTVFHRVNSTPQQPNLMFQAGSLGRFSDWSYWTMNAGSTYIRVNISELDTDEVDSLTVGDELYQFSTSILAPTGELPNKKQATFAGKVMSKNGDAIELKILPIFSNSTSPTTQTEQILEVFSPTIKYFYDQIGQLKNLNKQFPLYKTTSTKIELINSDIKYEPKELQLDPNTQNNIPGRDLINELYHRASFMPPHIEGNATSYVISPLDLGDNARKSSSGQQVSFPSYSKYRYYDWIANEVRGSIKQTLMSGFFGNFFINTAGKLRIPLGGYVQSTTETRRWYEFARRTIIAQSKDEALFQLKERIISLNYSLDDTSIQFIRNTQGEIIDFAPFKLFLDDDIRLVSGDQTNDIFAVFIDSDGKLHALLDRDRVIATASYGETLYYLGPDWFQTPGVLIDENGPVMNPPSDGFVKVKTVGGSASQDFNDSASICWLLHKSGKLYGAEVGKSIFTSIPDAAISNASQLKNPADSNFYLLDDTNPPENIPNINAPGGVRVEFKLSEADRESLLGVNPNGTYDVKKYIKYCLNLIPKVNGTRCPVLDITGTYVWHSSIFLCALPPDNPTIPPINGINQKIQFVFPSLEIGTFYIALYKKINTWNSNCDSSGQWTYTLNDDFDSELYDKLFKTKINNTVVYLPPRCYGFRSYGWHQFWILLNNGLFAANAGRSIGGF